MENTVVLKGKRSTVKELRNWYKEKLIDTGKAQNFEEKLDKQLAFEKKAIVVAGSVATVILALCPADGPVGEICAALATPLLPKLVDLKGKIIKEAVIGGKRKLEANFIKSDGSSEKVEIPEFNLSNLTGDITNFKSSIQDFVNENKKGVSR